MKEKQKERGPLSRALHLLYEKQPVVFINFVPALVLFLGISLTMSALVFITYLSGNPQYLGFAFVVSGYFYEGGILVLPPVLMMVNLLFNIRHKIHRFFDNMLYASGALSFLFILFSLTVFMFRGYFNAFIENEENYIVWDSVVSMMMQAVIICFIFCLAGFLVGQVILIFDKKVRIPRLQKTGDEKADGKKAKDGKDR